jgi:hydroxymethylpyrimidine/phosphomethylpyrimidine kinase
MGFVRRSCNRVRKMAASKQRAQVARTAALSIAGLDPGGGAGILADMRGFHAAGVYGTAVATMLTVQSASGLRAVYPATPAQVQAQLTELLQAQHIAAVKTGALGSRDVVRAVVETIEQQRARFPTLQVVVDPVMLPTRGGRRLLDVAALHVLRNKLLPLADVVTANVAEAEQLTGMRVARVSGR